MKTKIIINEVDCYIGNKYNYYRYATDAATQHQILLMKDDVAISLGRLNRASDDERFERIVFKTEVNNNVVKLWEKAVTIKFSFKSEYCSTNKEYEEAAVYNKPLREKLISILKKVYDLIEIDMPFKHFVRLSIY